MNRVRQQAAIEAAESRVMYKPEELTYNQRQMMAFHAGRTATPSTPKDQAQAEWAPKFDPINGKIAGARARVEPFGREAKE